MTHKIRWFIKLYIFKDNSADSSKNYFKLGEVLEKVANVKVIKLLITEKYIFFLRIKDVMYSTDETVKLQHSVTRKYFELFSFPKSHRLDFQTVPLNERLELLL